jgi:hypothetical protein
MNRRSIASTLAAAALAVALLAGCAPGAGGKDLPAPAYQGYLYMTDTSNGRVYSYDPATHAGSALSLVTTSANAAGEIAFYKGVGYVAMGFGGVWYFDPSEANPVAKMLAGSGSLNAQYFAFYGATKAYVSVADYSGSTGGVYAFDPSNPAAPVGAAIAGTSGKNFQELIVGPDGVYAADNSDGTVLRIDPADDTIAATIRTTATGGTTGLARGSYGGAAGVFVASNGGYASPSGSIDFIAAGAADGSTAATVADSLASDGSSIFPSRVLQLPNGNLLATGYGHSYLVALSGLAATATELKASDGSSFGSFDIAFKDGLAYVPVNAWNASNEVYVFDASGVQSPFSPVAVMGAGDNITNVAFYE